MVLCNFTAMTEADDVLFFDYEGNRLAYRICGNGPAPLVAFHGFGQRSDVFWPIPEAVSRQFTVYTVDLFLHGDSRYVGSSLLTKTSWQQLIGAFLDAHQIHRFSIMGFSLGGRFALPLIESFADRLDQVILIAPDGITHTLWYRLATATRAGRGLFRYVLRHLSTLNRLGHALVRVGLLNRTAMRFAELSLSTPEQRKLVYDTWTQFRLIYPGHCRDCYVAKSASGAHPVLHGRLRPYRTRHLHFAPHRPIATVRTDRSEDRPQSPDRVDDG